MSDTISLLVYLPYLHQKTIVKLPKTCQINILIEKLEEMYGPQNGTLIASYLYFPEREWILEKEKTFQELSIDNGAILYWI